MVQLVALIINVSRPNVKLLFREITRSTPKRFFGFAVKISGEHRNSEFIALIADKLQLQLKSDQAANF